VRPRPSSTPDGESHDRIDSNGTFSLRHNSRLYQIGLGRREREHYRQIAALEDLEAAASLH
jgi:hypothetical protein